MRVLMISNVMPQGMTTGGEVCTQNYIDAIRGAGHELDLMAYSRPGENPSLPPGYHSAGARHIESELAGRQAYQWLAQAFLTGAPYGVTKYQSGSLLRKVRELHAQQPYDCTIIDHTQLGWVIAHDALPRPWIFNAHNVESKLYSDQASEPGQRSAAKKMILKREARLLARLEQRLLQACSQTWVLTPAEHSAFAEAAPATAGRIHQFDLPGKPLPTGISPRVADLDVGLMGSWLWEANRHGLAWFLNEVVPKLPSSYKIHIAGKGGSAVQSAHSNVVYEGFVDNSIEFLRRCKVVAIPSLSGAGVQLKTIEVIAAGVPTVSTPVGLRGINTPPAFVSEAASSQSMADLIRSRVEQPLRADFDAGARWAASRREVFGKAVRDALSEVVSGK